MSNDIYGNNQQWGNAQLLTADKAILTIGGKSASSPGFLAQNFAMQYNRPVNNIYEIGSSNVYFGPTRAAGTFQIGRIVGTSNFLSVIPAEFWQDGGQPGDKIMSFAGPGSSWVLSGCIIESYGIATDANGLLCQENVSGRFCGLVVNGGSSSTSTSTSSSSSKTPTSAQEQSANYDFSGARFQDKNYARAFDTVMATMLPYGKPK